VLSFPKSFYFPQSVFGRPRTKWSLDFITQEITTHWSLRNVLSKKTIFLFETVLVQQEAMNGIETLPLRVRHHSGQDLCHGVLLRYFIGQSLSFYPSSFFMPCPNVFSSDILNFPPYSCVRFGIPLDFFNSSFIIAAWLGLLYKLPVSLV